MSSTNACPPGLIRQMDPTRDLEAVADLIEAAFELKNDPEGRVLIQNMRHHARLLARPEASFVDKLTVKASWSDGFVWEDQGKVVGNITLIPHMDGFKRVMMIANVSVQEAYRHKGIAHQLTLKALRYCQSMGIHEVYLQARHNNQVAIQLYRDLGFHFLHSVSVWRLRPKLSGLDELGKHGAELESGFSIHHRHPTDWKTQKLWLDTRYPHKTRWYAGPVSRHLSPMAWLNPFAWAQVSQTEHFALHKTNALAGVLTFQRRSPHIDQAWLALPPGLDPQDESQRASMLLRYFVREYWNHDKVNLEYPLGRATQGIQEAGFVLAHDLDWMAIRL